jgi:hypothetical protein
MLRGGSLKAKGLGGIDNPQAVLEPAKRRTYSLMSPMYEYNFSADTVDMPPHSVLSSTIAKGNQMSRVPETDDLRGTPRVL